jgi:dynein heavy chain
MPENYDILRVSLNFYINSAVLQSTLEERLERKVGDRYGPAGNKNLIYYLNDLNVPKMDEYQTICTHTILRQHLDHKHWYDRQKLTLKVIENCQYIATMKPNFGNPVNQRLQRHFSQFAISMPSQVNIFIIYFTLIYYFI